MLNGKATIIIFTAGLIEKILLYKISYFPEPHTHSKNKIEVDLSNYAIKSDLKNATGVDTSNFAKKTDLASLKSDIDKLDIDKLEKVPSGLSNLKSKVDKLDVDKLVPVPVNLRELSDRVKNDVKKTEYGELVEKVNNIKTTDTIDLVKTVDYDTKIGEIEKKILDHNHGKYITTQEFNKLTAENFATRLAQAKLATETRIDDFIEETHFDDKLKSLNEKVTSNKTKRVLVQRGLNKLSEKIKLISTKGLTKGVINN